ncbi:hypothetical protein PSI23_12480 [Xenorhabdus sp. XENO-10]|uniref:Uncharacterized protein n=1 Tax=Xenorhabdus yunnanensis TaxID=3025878 RepID=A0ABT5LHZ5_9GAMM|nr:hypothetical protein [Xenorhabdus yunnanensis]MDC9590098.1 hypothetical protein [Xenorhabdus yunnanensis]
MKISKTKLYIMLLFIVLIFYNHANAIEMVKGEMGPINIDNRGKTNNKRDDFYRYYNLTFINNSKYDMLNIKRTDEKCMYKTGNGNINLIAGERINQGIEDNNDSIIPWCLGEDKYINWTAEAYKESKKYQSCDIQFYVNFIPFPIITGSMSLWYTRVDTSSCKLKVTATCDGVDCLNIGYGVSNPPSNVVITIADDNNWEIPKITSPNTQYNASHNYIMIMGKGLMKDESLPLLVTSFDNQVYKVEIEDGSEDQWSAKVWINCGISGTISIKDIENTGVTINGPICEEIITSMQDGQVISAGEYSLSGLVNSDTVSDAKSIKVHITGYNEDNIVYSPTKEYTPEVNIETGEWRLDNLEAVCFVYYKAFVSSKLDLQTNSQFHFTNLSGRKEISYMVPLCPIKITKPKNYEVVSSTTDDVQNISIEGKAADETIIDGNISDLNYRNYSSGLSITGVGYNKWNTVAQNVPVGFMKITVSNTETAEVPIESSSDEVIILSSKIFSVEAKKDNVFTEFYGTSMPHIRSEDRANSLKPGVEILSDEVNIEEIVAPNEKGNWNSKNKHYAKRGVYFFTFQEYNDSENYAARDEKKIKCIGGNSGMNCINQ